jgi:uncharacterized protein (DUF1810 family)
MNDVDLERFVAAQNPIYHEVRAELAAGHKRTHWMWFVFPQIAGLGTSQFARTYAIGSLTEARAYLDHHLLGARLRECTGLTLSCGITDAHRIFGSPDDLKFRSSMTLFSVATAGAAPFSTALDAFFEGEPDARTIALLREP